MLKIEGSSLGASEMFVCKNVFVSEVLAKKDSQTSIFGKTIEVDLLGGLRVALYICSALVTSVYA